jgi:hypothetical protein
MNTYYVISNTFYNQYNFFDLDKSEKSISQIQKEILSIPDFCRSQQSIATSELKSYLVSGISFFTVNNNLIINGLINFDINQNIINIMGLCVPGISGGIGSFLINKVKEFAIKNNIIAIKLTCYDKVKNFYEKLGFKVKEEQIYYNSDDEDDDEISIKRYDMIYQVKDIRGGKKKSNKSKKRKFIKRKSKKRK